MAFSGALTLTDLNDYLGPSQACIKPVDTGSEATLVEDDPSSKPTTSIAIDQDGVYYEDSNSHATVATKDQARVRTKLETASISLDDCLACSGCVTSAESVLVSMQSHQELRRGLQVIRAMPAASQPMVVCSISPQSLASLSAYLAHTSSSDAAPETLLSRIRHHLSSRLHFDAVFDTTLARHVALREHNREFRERKRRALGTSCTTASTLPMLASACPGWVCYAEKAQHDLLPHVASTKSPMQIGGVLAKKWLASRRLPYSQQADSDPQLLASVEMPEWPSYYGNTYHVSVMPCYDKKLEAARATADTVSASSTSTTPQRDVDLVLTTGELYTLLSEEGCDLTAPVAGGEAAPQKASITDATSAASFVSLPPEIGSSSGGYLFSVMHDVWSTWRAEHPDVDNSARPSLSVRTIRSSDYTDFVLRAPGATAQQFNEPGDIIFKGAHCYGFRNLQNLTRKLRKQVRASSAAATTITDEGGDGSAGSVKGKAAMRGRGMKMSRRGRGALGGLVSNGDYASQIASLAERIESEDIEHPYDYVEVMACPGGCVNGGGQLRPPDGSGTISMAGSASAATGRALASGQTEAEVDKPVDTTPNVMDIDGGEQGKAEMADSRTEKGWKGTSKQWVRNVEQAYWSTSQDSKASDSVGQQEAWIIDWLTRPTSDQDKEANVLADRYLEDMLGEEGSEDMRERLLHNEYKAVKDEAVSGLAVQW